MSTKRPHTFTTIAELPDPEIIRPEEILQQFENKDIDLICVLGPTASGKTRYAVGLAHALNELRAVRVNAGATNCDSGSSRQGPKSCPEIRGRSTGEWTSVQARIWTNMATSRITLSTS